MIVERSEAKQLGLSTYETGRPCKNGHSTYRYVQSGSCADCVAAHSNPGATPNSAARREARAQFVQVKLAAFQVDLDTLKASALAFGMMRFAEVQMGDVYPGLLPVELDGHVRLYKFNCHADDIAALRELARTLHRSRAAPVPVTKALSRALSEVKVEPVPGWADRP